MDVTTFTVIFILKTFPVFFGHILTLFQKKSNSVKLVVNILIRQYPISTLSMLLFIYAENQSKWSEWELWTTCSASCGPGARSRRRLCSGQNCEGDSQEIQDCISNICQGEKHVSC